MVKKKLHARLEQREKSMIKAQDEELKNLVAPNKTAAKIKKMLLIHKHMVAMEKLRYSIATNMMNYSTICSHILLRKTL